MSIRVHSSASDELTADIEAVGDKIRTLQAQKAEESVIKPYKSELQALRLKLNTLTAASFDPLGANEDQMKKELNNDDMGIENKKSK